MLFGQSLFQSVLERLAEEADDVEEDAAPGTFRIRGLSAGFVAERVEADTAEFLRQQAFHRDLADDLPAAEPQATQEPVMPPHLARLSVVEIAEDLAIGPRDGLATLSEKRRAFARLNHPDGVEEKYRDRATTRMKVANLLIDEAIRRLS